MNDAQWYYAENDEQRGPVSLVEIRLLITSQRLQRDDLVWCDGMDDWRPAGEVPELAPAVKKPKPVRKASPAESKPPQPEAPTPDTAPAVESKPEAAKPAAREPKAANTQRQESRPAAPPVQVAPAEEPSAEMSNFEAVDELEEGYEDDVDEIDELAERLFAGPQFPAKRPRGHDRQAYREPEIVRETIREVVVMETADGQLSAAALFVQLVCWAICGLAVLAAAVVCALRVFSSGVDSASTLLLGVAIGSFVLARSAQRCLEILAAIGSK